MSSKQIKSVGIYIDGVKELKISGGQVHGFEQGVVVSNSDVAEVRDVSIASREAVLAWSELQQAVANLNTAEDQKQDLLKQVGDLRANLGKPKFREAYDRLIASAANHGALIPYLSKLYELCKGYWSSPPTI